MKPILSGIANGLVVSCQALPFVAAFLVVIWLLAKLIPHAHPVMSVLV